MAETIIGLCLTKEFVASIIGNLAASLLYDAGKSVAADINEFLSARLLDGKMPPNHELSELAHRSLRQAMLFAHAACAHEFGEKQPFFPAIMQAWKEKRLRDQSLLYVRDTPQHTWLDRFGASIKNAAAFNAFDGTGTGLHQLNATSLTAKELDARTESMLKTRLHDWVDRYVESPAPRVSRQVFFETGLERGFPIDGDANRRLTVYAAWSLFFREGLKDDHDERSYKAYIIAKLEELSGASGAVIDKVALAEEINNKLIEKLAERIPDVEYFDEQFKQIIEKLNQISAKQDETLELGRERHKESMAGQASTHARLDLIISTLFPLIFEKSSQNAALACAPAPLQAQLRAMLESIDEAATRGDTRAAETLSRIEEEHDPRALADYLRTLPPRAKAAGQALTASPETANDSRIASIASVLDTLPERQRLVIALRYHEKLDDAEVAEVISCPASDVRRLHDAAMRAIDRWVPDLPLYAKLFAICAAGEASITTRAVVAAVRELTPGLIRHLQRTTADLRALDYDVFRHLVGEFMTRHGFRDVRHIGPTSGTAADLFACTPGSDLVGADPVFVRVRRDHNDLGLSVVHEVLGAMIFERPSYGWRAGLVVTMTDVDAALNDGMRDRVHRFGVGLRDRRDLLTWLQDYRPNESGLWLPPAVYRQPIQTAATPSPASTPCRW